MSSLVRESAASGLTIYRAPVATASGSRMRNRNSRINLFTLELTAVRPTEG